MQRNSAHSTPNGASALQWRTRITGFPRGASSDEGIPGIPNDPLVQQIINVKTDNAFHFFAFVCYRYSSNQAHFLLRNIKNNNLQFCFINYYYPFEIRSLIFYLYDLFRIKFIYNNICDN